MHNIRTQKRTASTIVPNKMVSLYKILDEYMIVSSYYQPGKNNLRKLNCDCCVNTVTNEIIPYNRDGHRNTEGLRKTLKEFKKYLKFFRGDSNEAMVTLTYKSFMNDQKRISADIKKFARRLRKKCPDAMYLYIREPDDNGSWHVHFIIKDISRDSWGLDENEVRKMWSGDGYYVSVGPIYNIEGLSNYFDYFANSKKASRLHYYYDLDNNVHLFEHSTNMKIECLRLTYEDAIKEAEKSGKTLFNKECFEVRSVDGKFILNIIQREFYKDKGEVDYDV